MPTKTNGRNKKRMRSGVTTTPRVASIDQFFSALKQAFLPISEAAIEMGLAKNTLRKYCQEAIFSNAQAFGREWVISRNDIDWWKENRQGKVGRPSAGT